MIEITIRMFFIKRLPNLIVAINSLALLFMPNRLRGADFFAWSPSSQFYAIGPFVISGWIRKR